MRTCACVWGWGGTMHAAAAAAGMHTGCPAGCPAQQCPRMFTGCPEAQDALVPHGIWRTHASSSQLQCLSWARLQACAGSRHSQCCAACTVSQQQLAGPAGAGTAPAPHLPLKVLFLLRMVARWSLKNWRASGSVQNSVWRLTSYAVLALPSKSPLTSSGRSCVRAGAVFDQSTYWSRPL